MADCLFETYNNYVMPHGHHIYATSSDMAMVKMCAYPSYQNALPHLKFVLRCCANFPRIGIPDQKSYRHNSNTSHSIRFHIYHLISRFTVHGRRPIDEKKIYHICLQDPATVSPAKIYTKESLLL